MIQEYTVMHLFSGIGGAALGFQQAVSEYKGMVGRFRTLAGIDVDPEACEDFRSLTGSPAIEMDLFSCEDYIAFHGHEPPAIWREMRAADIFDAVDGEYPDVVFLSPPCKGFSGLLPEKAALSEKYQALNRLVVRGLRLVIEAFSEDLPAVIMLENVPRITSRGRYLLKEVKNLLGRHGYVFHEGYHDCGEIGGLGQHRKRYLLVARNEKKMPAFIYRPQIRKLKTIGDVIGTMPIPDDPAGGPMHKLPRLQWKTWIRLALIPAGCDWRALNNIHLNEFRIFHNPRNGVYKVARWEEVASTIIGSAKVQGSNGVAAVADPRINCKPRSGVYKVQSWNEPALTVVGAGDIHSGSAAVADPRRPDYSERPDPPPVIISPDGTWHRPLTTYELAILQGFPTHTRDGKPLKLTGQNDAR